MPIVQALNGQSLLQTQPKALRKASLRLLKTDPVARTLKRTADHGGAAPRTGVEAVLWILLAAGIHAAIVAAVWNRTSNPRVARAPQEIELLRPSTPTPEPKLIEPPPPRKIESPKVSEPPKIAPPPPAALRTQAAETPQPNTMTVAENLTASKTSGPVAAIPTPPTAPPVRAEEPVTEPTGYAGYLNNPAPVYPKAAQRLGMQGRVVLRVRVLANGQVGDVEIKQSSGKSLLDEAALVAVKGWTFAPAKRGNTPIDAWTQVPIEFKLAQ